MPHRQFRLLFAGCALFFVSCQSQKTKIEPPEIPADLQTSRMDPQTADKMLKEISQRQKTAVTSWMTNYRRGLLWKKTDPVLACSLFAPLVTEGKFPLRKIAAIHTLDTCASNAPAQETALTLLPKDETWLKEMSLRSELNYARSKKDRARIYQVATELSMDGSVRREEKVTLMQEAFKNSGTREQRWAAQKRLYELAPRLQPNPKPELYFNVATDFRRARKFAQARTYYQKILNQKGNLFSTIYDAQQGIRTTYKVERNKELHKEWSQRIANSARTNWKKNPKSKSAVDLYLNSQLQLARVLWTQGLFSDTEKILDQTQTELKDQTSLYELYWIRGRMMEEKQNFEKAVEWFQLALAEKVMSTDFRERLSWYLAWNLRKLKRYEEAKDILEKLADTTSIPWAISKFKFWTAMTLLDQEKKREAESLFDEIIEDDPLGYYRILASWKSKKPISLLDGQKSASTDVKPWGLGSIFDDVYFDWLVAADENKVAGLYLNQVMRKMYSERKDSDSNLEYFIRQYARSKNFLFLFARLSELDTKKRHGLLKANSAFVFPNPYESDVQKSATKTGVPAALIYAIMRQESSFDPEARSPADAFGLMQVLPEVAARVAKDYNLSYPAEDSLFDPDINIPVGAHFLHELQSKFSKRFIPTVASYNASEEAMLGWINTRHRGDTLEFIEDIPYEETQGYVKLIMRNYVFYMSIFAGKSGVKFPEDVMKL